MKEKLILKPEAKEILLSKRDLFKIDEKEIEEIEKIRKDFIEKFSKDNIKKLPLEKFLPGHGIKEGNFCYELEWKTIRLGSIRGGSKYKFGYDKDYEKIKKLILQILDAKDEIKQFYNNDGTLSKFSKEIIRESTNLKGIGRAFIGKILAVYFPEIFIQTYIDQDNFLRLILEDYQIKSSGVRLFLENNYSLLNIKNEIASEFNNYQFCKFLYYCFPKLEKIEEELEPDEEKISALETEHYQSLVHRNFNKLFGELKYADPETQNEKKGHFDTQEVGIMDFLAIDKNDNFIVIELKRSSTDQTMGQILRYMGWVKKNLCKDKQKVTGIILAEDKDVRLDYALELIPYVKFKKMKLEVKIED
jgi:hypothetical protein